MNGGDTRKFSQFKALDDDKNDNPTNKRRLLTRQNDMDADEWYNHLEDDNSRKRGHSQQNSDQPVRKSSRMRSATKRYDIATESARPHQQQQEPQHLQITQFQINWLQFKCNLVST